MKHQDLTLSLTQYTRETWMAVGQGDVINNALPLCQAGSSCCENQPDDSDAQDILHTVEAPFVVGFLGDSLVFTKG